MAQLLYYMQNIFRSTVTFFHLLWESTSVIKYQCFSFCRGEDLNFSPSERIKDCQKYWGSEKGKAEFVISVLVPAVPDNIELSHMIHFTHHP